VNDIKDTCCVVGNCKVSGVKVTFVVAGTYKVRGV
jgi:hypothetical protein